MKSEYPSKTLEERLCVESVRKYNRSSGGEIYSHYGVKWNGSGTKYLLAHVAIEKMLKFDDGKNKFFDHIPNSIMYRGMSSKTTVKIKNIDLDLR